MPNHPFIMPHPPNQGRATCGKPVNDPCHDPPYGENVSEIEERVAEAIWSVTKTTPFSEATNFQQDLCRLEAKVAIRAMTEFMFVEPQTQEHGEPYE